MRVLHVISCLVKSDGHSQFCMAIAERMAAQGMEHRIFAMPAQSESALPDPKRLIHYATGRSVGVLNVRVHLGLERQIQAIMRDFKPDVVHLHGGWHPVLFFAARACKQLGVPFVLSLHGSLRPAVIEGDRRLKKRLAWWLYQRRLVEMADVIHVSTETEKTDLARLGFHKPVAVVPNGIDLEDFSRKDAKMQRGVKNEGGRQRTEGGSVKREMRTVLYLGRLHPLKGLDILVDAWGAVKKKQSAIGNTQETIGGRTVSHRGAEITVGEGRRTEGSGESTALRLPCSDFAQWELVIAGPDEQGTKGRLVAQAEGVGLLIVEVATDQLAEQPANQPSNPDIIFTGPLYGEEKARVMAMADVFVLPTRSENFGIAVAEALACGVPVITTKGAPWSELLGSEGSAISAISRGSELSRESAISELSAISEEGAISRGSAMGVAVRDVTNSLKLNALNQLNTLPPAANGRCGWWIDIGVEPLGEALKEAMALTDEVRREMGENGRRLVEAKYQWGEVVRRMAVVYEGLLKGGA